MEVKFGRRNNIKTTDSDPFMNTAPAFVAKAKKSKPNKSSVIINLTGNNKSDDDTRDAYKSLSVTAKRVPANLDSNTIVTETASEVKQPKVSVVVNPSTSVSELKEEKVTILKSELVKLTNELDNLRAENLELQSKINEYEDRLSKLEDEEDSDEEQGIKEYEEEDDDTEEDQGFIEEPKIPTDPSEYMIQSTLIPVGSAPEEVRHGKGNLTSKRYDKSFYEKRGNVERKK